jgi:hypothetical protein
MKDSDSFHPFTKLQHLLWALITYGEVPDKIDQTEVIDAYLEDTEFFKDGA